MRLTLIVLLAIQSLAFGQGVRLVSVDNVADLIARTPVDNERVSLSGWRTPGDFGAPRILRHDPTNALATNLGCIYATGGSGRYIADDCDSGTLDVRWFGAPIASPAIGLMLYNTTSNRVQFWNGSVWYQP